LGTEVNTANLPFEPPVLTPTVTYHVVAAYRLRWKQNESLLDGALVATNNMGGNDLTLTQAVSGYIGASLFADPDVAGSIDEVRVWKGVLSAAQVAATHSAGPASVPNFNVTLSASVSGGNLVLACLPEHSWRRRVSPDRGHRLPGASPPSFSVPISAGVPMKFYRVQVQ